MAEETTESTVTIRLNDLRVLINFAGPEFNKVEASYLHACRQVSILQKQLAQCTDEQRRSMFRKVIADKLDEAQKLYREMCNYGESMERIAALLNG